MGERAASDMPHRKMNGMINVDVDVPSMSAILESKNTDGDDSSFFSASDGSCSPCSNSFQELDYATAAVRPPSVARSTATPTKSGDDAVATPHDRNKEGDICLLPPKIAGAVGAPARAYYGDAPLACSVKHEPTNDSCTSSTTTMMGNAPPAGSCDLVLSCANGEGRGGAADELGNVAGSRSALGVMTGGVVETEGEACFAHFAAITISGVKPGVTVSIRSRSTKTGLLEPAQQRHVLLQSSPHLQALRLASSA